MRLVLLSAPLFAGVLLMADAWSQRLTLMKQTFLYGFASMNGMKRQYLLALDQARLEFQVGEGLLIGVLLVSIVVAFKWRTRTLRAPSGGLILWPFLMTAGLGLFVFTAFVDYSYAWYGNHLTSGVNPAWNLLSLFWFPSPLTGGRSALGLFAAGGFGLFLVSLSVLAGFRKALLAGLVAVALFEAGLALFDPGEMGIHIVNSLPWQLNDGDWMRQVPVDLISNTAVLVASSLSSLCLVIRH